MDYDRERFTLDEGYVRAVYKVFVSLYEKGYIYRDNYMEAAPDQAGDDALSEIQESA